MSEGRARFSRVYYGRSFALGKAMCNKAWELVRYEQLGRKRRCFYGKATRKNSLELKIEGVVARCAIYTRVSGLTSALWDPENILTVWLSDFTK